jgi:predicted pyridoxine 5'-phosphate oxidase superfamily flavin-nucleotide-binding protein
MTNLRSPSLTGVLAIDLGARQRVRVNGTAHLDPDGRVVLVTEQVYGNCPQYIHPRDVAGMRALQHAPARTADRLDDRHAWWLAGADTFFLATALPGTGADASHRGGRAGFVHVVDERRLLFPDYRGNNYFNSLGNIASYPRAGLLVPDFSSGNLLQLSGAATILWDDPMRAYFPGAQRLVQIDVERVVELPQATALRFGAPTETPALP